MSRLPPPRKVLGSREHHKWSPEPRYCFLLQVRYALTSDSGVLVQHTLPDTAVLHQDSRPAILAGAGYAHR